MKIEIDPWQTLQESPRYCETCDTTVLDVWNIDRHGKIESRNCPVCGGSPTLLELGTPT